MAQSITQAGKKEILDNGFGTNNWYGHLHSSGSAVPASGNKMGKASHRVTAWSTTTGSGNATAQPAANLSFAAASADVTANDVPSRLAFWTAPGATGTLLAWADIYETGTTRLDAVEEEDQAIVINASSVVFTLS